MAMTTKKAKKPGTSSNGAAPTSEAKNGSQETVSGYFRKYFKQNPKALNERSNEVVLKQWQEDHPGEEVSSSVKSGLSNIKSVLRSKKRRKSTNDQTELPAGVTAKPIKKTTLEAIEESIDTCLNQVRATENESLAAVIHHLRQARNAVVWHMGEPA